MMKFALSPALAPFLLSSLLLACVPAAHADSITLTLSAPHQSSTSAGVFSYAATVSASSTNSGIEYLNGDLFSIQLPALLNDSGYLNNFPLDLTPGSSYSGVLFTLLVPASAGLGDFPGSFSITGGPTTASTVTLATVTFDAQITPEPSSFLLLGTGLLAFAGWSQMRRRTIAISRS
jgi:hypothetical protein